MDMAGTMTRQVALDAALAASAEGASTEDVLKAAADYEAFLLGPEPPNPENYEGGLVPVIGAIVHYTLSMQDAERINRRRVANQAKIANDALGYVAHTGNAVAVGDVFPMVITRRWGDRPESKVNGQVLLDGNDTLWVTSVVVGEGVGTYSWPC